jgi:RNA polymerase sigma-70 factor, ECF subfamily
MPLDATPDTAASTVASDAARRDRDIVELLSAGASEAAFERLASRYAPKVYRLCLAMLREPARAEEAAQDSLLRAWRAMAGYQAQAGALSTWLYAITRNRCLTLLERWAPVSAALDDEAVQAEIANQAAPTAADGSGHALLRRLVGALPEPQRLALTLYYFEERAVAEVAAMLGLPEATVKTHLHRGRARLRAQLAEQGLDDPALWLA